MVMNSASTCDTNATNGHATVLAMAKATPPNAISQKDYPDFYFRATNSEHMTDLKAKFQRICDKSGIQNRYFHLNEEILQENPDMQTFWGESLDVRQEIMVEEIPKLGAQAARKAVAEWGRPLSAITHLIFCTTGGMDLPGADWVLTKEMGLRPDIRRLMLYSQGCFGGGTALRMAKDLAENNKGARVLVVCSEMTVVTFRGPHADHMDSLVGQALFSDGASALVVGTNPIREVETPWFELHWAGSCILADSSAGIQGHWKQIGLTFHLDKRVPEIVSQNLPSVFKAALDNIPNQPYTNDLNIDGLTAAANGIFWIAHPGGPAILNQMERTLQLRPEKFKSTREVLADYGNMSSACVLFIMDQLRRNSVNSKAATTGEGLEWGVLMSFGPGITCETVLLKSCRLTPAHLSAVSA